MELSIKTIMRVISRIYPGMFIELLISTEDEDGGITCKILNCGETVKEFNDHDLFFLWITEKAEPSELGINKEV